MEVTQSTWDVIFLLVAPCTVAVGYWPKPGVVGLIAVVAGSSLVLLSPASFADTLQLVVTPILGAYAAAGFRAGRAGPPTVLFLSFFPLGLFVTQWWQSCIYWGILWLLAPNTTRLHRKVVLTAVALPTLVAMGTVLV